ncbi:MAG TPA: flavin reductase family protein [Actinocrinis sp.]|jgi:flavin reductase (DIM6/NTAB) family NADH-FMN oxidoreductase RutF
MTNDTAQIQAAQIQAAQIDTAQIDTAQAEAGDRLEHIESEPAILYFGTPVVLISTLNPDGTANLAPMSSCFWLGWRAVLGMNAGSQTSQNMLRTGECVLNLPSVREADAVDRLARTTGSREISASKLARGYRHEPDKFGISGLTARAARTVAPPRVAECPVNLEAVVEAADPLAADDDRLRGSIIKFEVRVQRVHIHPEIALPGRENRIDPDRWRPLIMSFQHFYGLGPRVRPSTLARIDEELYRSLDTERARQAPLREAAAA